jgi:hypothetical protein
MALLRAGWGAAATPPASPASAGSAPSPFRGGMEQVE